MKTKNQKITFRCDDDLHEFIVRLSDLDDCSMSSVIRLFLMHNVRAIQELKNNTNPEVAKWWFQEQAAMAVGAYYFLRHTAPPPPAKGHNMGRKAHKPLDTVEGVRDELIRLYKKAKKGDIEAKELGKLVFTLNSLTQHIEKADIIKRLDDIEEAQELLDSVAA